VNGASGALVTLARISEGSGGERIREPIPGAADFARFTSIAVHDLRSPLQVISGFAALLERLYGPRLDDQGRDFVRWILAGAARMEALMAGLLVYAQIGAGPVEVAPVDLGSVVQDVMTALADTGAAGGGEVTWDGLPVVAGNADQLRHLLRNLVTNALRFVADDTTPAVQITAQNSVDGWCVAVADNGIGIDPAAREDIFEMSTRLHSQERYPGSGMGLAICRRIVTAAGGRIWVDAGDNGGSVFRFTIPPGTIPPGTVPHSTVPADTLRPDTLPSDTLPPDIGD
jgi:light-regulated signal transduction histidine kinase (bacteriophytochrome)